MSLVLTTMSPRTLNQHSSVSIMSLSKMMLIKTSFLFNDEALSQRVSDPDKIGVSGTLSISTVINPLSLCKTIQPLLINTF